MAPLQPPSITIVTPCLNAAATLPETLASVRSQGYPRLEHVIVDGGSTDGTLELLCEAEGVRFVSEPDRGLTHALNKGIGMASGDVIGWLNADDVYLPGALDAVGEAFARRPDAEWATGRCLIIDAAGSEIRGTIARYKDLLLRHYSYPALLTQNFVAAPATFARRDALEAVGLFDERFRYSMDYDVWLQLGRRGDPIVIDRPLASFRMAEGSLSMSGFEKQFAEHALNARERGEGHPFAVALNQVASRGIVLAYRLMRLVRSRSSAST
jgi:glycosyltransferase involved in cell wall biosynthesis